MRERRRDDAAWWSPAKIRFAPDPALEGDGFEPSVPQQIRSRFRDSSPVSHDGLTVSRPGTEGSNPSPSSGESGANLTFGSGRWTATTRCLMRLGLSRETDCARTLYVETPRGQVLGHTAQSIAQPGPAMDAGVSRRGRS